MGRAADDDEDDGLYKLARWGFEQTQSPSSAIRPSTHSRHSISTMKFTTATLLALVPLAIAAPANVARENWDKEPAAEPAKGESPYGAAPPTSADARLQGLRRGRLDAHLPTGQLREEAVRGADAQVRRRVRVHEHQQVVRG